MTRLYSLVQMWKIVRMRKLKTIADKITVNETIADKITVNENNSRQNNSK